MRTVAIANIHKLGCTQIKRIPFDISKAQSWQKRSTASDQHALVYFFVQHSWGPGSGVIMLVLNKKIL